MSTYTQLIYQIVFSPKNHEKVLAEENRAELFRYIIGILKANSSHVYCINGVSDHIHIALSIPPSKSVSSIVADVKRSTSLWIKQKRIFPHFTYWQKGYGAFTYSNKDKEFLIGYINNQEVHHRQVTFVEEYISLLDEFDVEYDEWYIK